VTSGEQLRIAESRLSEGRWEDARQLLAAVLAEDESAEALDGMGMCLWWLGEIRESLHYRERAYAAYVVERRHTEATMTALDVSVSYLSNLDNPVAAQGWIGRARRAAARSGDDRLTGWLWLMDGYTSRDPAVQRDLLARALELARETGDVDLELAALADLGLCLVVNGEVPAGLALLDEAMAGTLAGECERLDTVVWASCSMLAACRLIGDRTRAAKWCQAAERFAETYGCPFLQATCRAHYGRVLVATGQWEIAEAELQHALTMSAGCGPAARIEALAGLAELRLRQGAVDVAEALLVETGGGPEVSLLVAEVMTATGHPDRAISVLRADLDQAGDQELRYPLLQAALVDAYLALGGVDEAMAVLDSVAEPTGRGHPQAAAAFERARGRVAARRGEPESAASLLRASSVRYDELGLPFQAARTRAELAEVLADHEPALAVVEATWALDRLQRLGAERDAASVAAFLRACGVATKPGPRELGLLSRRERDVLALLPRGLTNPEIGAELFISPRTVAHHVSSILVKLNLRTRAEAAAFAVTSEREPPES
jgi:ATP/maltotriose-dependent transcriptional regulator MalT